MMNEVILSIRMRLLTDRYIDARRRKIGSWEPVSYYFPTLSRREQVNAFRNKEAGIRGYLRLVSLAVLCEYISVRLTPGLSEMLQDIAEAYARQMDRLRFGEPLVFLLIKLHQNGREIAYDETYHEDLFEQFFILERQWRLEGFFFTFLRVPLRAKAEVFDDYVRWLITHVAGDEFWRPMRRPLDRQESLTNPERLFLRILCLLEFLVDLETFLDGVESPFLQSVFWHYFKSFLTSVRVVEKRLFALIEAFGSGMTGRLYKTGVIDPRDRRSDEAIIDSSVEAIRLTIERLTSGRAFKNLDEYLARDPEPLFSYAGDVDLPDEEIDLERLRFFLKGSE